MPYIRKEERIRYNKTIDKAVHLLVDKLPGDNGKNFSAGDLNYILSSIVWKLWDKSPSYSNGSKLIGVLDDVKEEFRRRRINPYEDEKCKTNGDIL